MEKTKQFKEIEKPDYDNEFEEVRDFFPILIEEIIDLIDVGIDNFELSIPYVEGFSINFPVQFMFGEDPINFILFPFITNDILE